jgi:hypothetical protein
VRLLFTGIQMQGVLDGMDLVRAVHARWPRVLLVVASGRMKPPKAEIQDDWFVRFSEGQWNKGVEWQFHAEDGG